MGPAFRYGSDQSLNFCRLIRYCRYVLGGRQRLVSQRMLADALSVTSRVAGRFISGDAGFYELKPASIMLLAEACELHVGTLFVWVESGPDAAMRHEQLLRQAPTGFSLLDYLLPAVDLARSMQTMETPLVESVQRAPEGLNRQGNQGEELPVSKWSINSKTI